MSRPSPATLFLFALLGCVRARPSPDVATPRARRPSAPDAAVPPVDASAPPSDVALPPLFARKVGCVSRGAARSFARRRAVDGGFVARELSYDEVVARPWLWGQYPSGCAGVGWRTRDAVDSGVGDNEVLRGESPRQRVLAVAEGYLGWGRVDDYQRWAPFDCMLPPSSRPQADLGARAPHGRKVYYLYALDRAAYLEHRDVPRQVVVKEAWAPEEVPSSEAISNGYPTQCAAERDGVCVQPGAFQGLFVMLRAEVTPDTDAGWTYATIDPRGEVTALGRIASCMGCHQDAPHGRLFGIPTGAGLRWRDPPLR